MPLRMVEIILPSENGDQLEKIDDNDVLGVWRESIDDDRLLIRVLVNSDKTEAIVSRFESQFEEDSNFRLMIFEVQATIPHPESPKNDDSADEDEDDDGDNASEQSGEDEDEDKAKDSQQVACAELVQKLSDTSLINRMFVASALLSTVVATVGLLRDQVVVVIGAMMIAPLLTPNMTLALATTLGDIKLALRAVVVNAVGLLVSLMIAIVMGMIFTIDTEAHEIAMRSQVNLTDLVVALASGAAGAMAITTGLSAGLVGVMVAAALLPPLVVSGLFIGSGDWAGAGRAALLLAANLICVNLAAVATFLWQGIRPNRWWEAKRAKRMVVYAAIVWVVLLAALIGVIILAGKQPAA